VIRESDFKCFNKEPALLPVNIASLRGKKWKKMKKRLANKGP